MQLDSGCCEDCRRGSGLARSVASLPQPSSVGITLHKRGERCGAVEEGSVDWCTPMIEVEIARMRIN